MYELERQVAERTQRLLDMAEGIRMERFLRDGSRGEPPDAFDVSIAQRASTTDVPVHDDCGPTRRTSHPRAA